MLDFSMCSFVDHTVMEGLESYISTFEKKEGSIEIIGLDKHDTDSKHPFAIRKIIPLATLKPIEQYFTKRQTSLETTAQEFKCQYVPQKNTKTAFLSDFVFFNTREINYFYNSIVGDNKSYSVLDVEFTEGAFIAREVIKTTVMHIKLDKEMPIFTLDKEGLLHMIYSLAGFKDIKIENHSDFNKRFYLRGESKSQISSLFTDELILFFESHPYYHVESNGNSLLILKKERLLSVQEVKAMIYFGQQLEGLLQG